MTTLARGISATATTVDVSDETLNVVRPFLATIEDETVRVRGLEYVSGAATRWNVDRGIDSTPATHAGGATVTLGDGGAGGAAEPGTLVAVPPESAPDIVAALVGIGNAPPDAANPYLSYADYSLGLLLTENNDAGGESITNLVDPSDPQDAATKAYADALPAQPLAAVLAAGADTGGTVIVHVPAVDVAALTRLIATGTGTGNANARPEATVEDGVAVAGPRAEATGTGNTDACTYAESVDGDALADNDARVTGTGLADAGCYANAVDGASPESIVAFAGAEANTTGNASASVKGIATANTGTAHAGSLATRGAASAGMESIVDGTSARMAFNGTTPIAIPEIPASPTAAQVAAVLVALGLATQGV